VIGRIPILDVQPVVRVPTELGPTAPAKAVPHEIFQVTATIFREGHEMLGAGVVLLDPAGQPQPLIPMRELDVGSDRYGAEVAATSEGLWHFVVEAWGDPFAHWLHDAEIKIPLGQDIELMLAEGALLLQRAAGQIKTSKTMPPEVALAARTARTVLTTATFRRTPVSPRPPEPRSAPRSARSLSEIC
jgi:starch synthase (maltosyl-transferring)